MVDQRDGRGTKWRGRIITYTDDLGRSRWRAEPAPVEPDYTVTGVLERCRPAGVHEVPLGAQRFAEGAARAGWRGRVTYARGWRYARRGRPSVMTKIEVHSVAVRLAHRSGWRAVAVWENGGTAGAWLWLPQGSGRYLLPRELGVTVIKEWIEARGRLTVQQVIEMSKSDG